VSKRFHRVADLNLPIVAIVLAIALGGISCQSFYRYSVFDLTHGRSNSEVFFSSSQYSAQENNEVGNVIIDSSGTLWSLDVYYNQKLISPADIMLDVDSVSIDFTDLVMHRVLPRPVWRREAADYMPYTIVRIGPIGVPVNYKSDIEVNFRLSAYNRCTDTLLFTRHYHLLMER
jgi:hypothetical protein